MTTLILKICVANPKSGVNVNEVYQDISKNLENSQSYLLDSSQVSGAAIELVVLVSGVAAIVTIADFLWKMWEKHKEKGQLYITIDPEKRVNIMISDQTTEKEIQEFQKKIDDYFESGEINKMDEEILYEVENTKIWKKIK